MNEEKPHRGSNLSDYIEKFSHNLKGRKPVCIELSDELLSELVNDLDQNQFLTSAQLFQIGFGSWRGALSLASAGASSQVPALLRHCLECSMYSYVFSKDDDLLNDWLNREFDGEAKKRLRNGRSGPLFKAKEHLKKENPDLLERINSSLAHYIDFGAHPNIFQLWEASQVVADENETYATMLLGTEKNRNDAYATVVAAAMQFIDVFQMIWPIRFDLASGSGRLAEISGQLRLFVDSNAQKATSGK